MHTKTFTLCAYIKFTLCCTHIDCIHPRQRFCEAIFNTYIQFYKYFFIGVSSTGFTLYHFAITLCSCHAIESEFVNRNRLLLTSGLLRPQRKYHNTTRVFANNNGIIIYFQALSERLSALPGRGFLTNLNLP